VTAYAPHSAGLIGGIAMVVAGASRTVGVIVVVASTAAETAKTIFERYEKRKEKERGE